MKECCSNCKHKMTLTKYDYSHGGCEHTEYEGFACTAFASEGDIIHMVGSNPDKGSCEMFMEKK